MIQLKWKKNKLRSASQAHSQAKLLNATPPAANTDVCKIQHLIVRGWRWNSIGLPAAPTGSALPF